MQKTLRRYPYFIGIIILCIISIIVQILVIYDCFNPLLTFEVDAVSSVMSTCSEVIAGLYGITLTGYIFFADRFQNTSKEDVSLYDAVQALLLRYNHLAGIISLMCLLCTVSAELVVLYGNNTLLHPIAYRFWVDETPLFFFWNFNFILYFVISVLDPQKVSRISKQKREKLSADKAPGDADEFMKDWQAIEEILYGLRDKLAASIRHIPTSFSKNKPEIVHTLENLRNYGRISNGLWKKLNKLRQYYYLSMHDPNATITQDMCKLAQEVRKELEEKYTNK